MSPDPVRRSAARTATLVAVPVALAAGLFSVWALGGFHRGDESPPTSATTSSRPQASSPVPMQARSLGAEAVTVCLGVVAELPDVVREAHRRPVTAGSEQNAAYGEPPLTLACGTSRPAFAPTDRLYSLSGVCWYARPGAAGTVWTTVDRRVPVTVTVPGAPEGAAQRVIVFSTAIAAADPRAANPPSGCT